MRTPLLLTEIDRLIRRDPARRGLIATEDSLQPLCQGHLSSAAIDLAQTAQHVVIVTGFFIPGSTPPAAETDGPAGAALLAASLNAAGMTIQIVTDRPCRAAVTVAACEMGLSADDVVAFDHDVKQIEGWFHQQRRRPASRPWTHLIAIERVGPSHSFDSIRLQLAHHNCDSDLGVEAFERLVSAVHHNRCYNMRGHCLDEHTAPLHRLFELAHDDGSVKTIGIGDGGNEIGMGTIPWWELYRRLSNPNVAHIPCRIRTDWTIVAGVSNWGGMALGAATLWISDKIEAMSEWTSGQQQQLLEKIVRDGPAVDGITRLCEPTVDGLPFLTYIQPWEGIRRAVGLR